MAHSCGLKEGKHFKLFKALTVLPTGKLVMDECSRVIKARANDKQLLVKLAAAEQAAKLLPKVSVDSCTKKDNTVLLPGEAKWQEFRNSVDVLCKTSTEAFRLEHKERLHKLSNIIDTACEALITAARSSFVSAAKPLFAKLAGVVNKFPTYIERGAQAQLTSARTSMEKCMEHWREHFHCNRAAAKIHSAPRTLCHCGRCMLRIC